MPRSKLTVLNPPEAKSPAPPPTLRVIPADAVFQLGELQAVLGLQPHTLRREARLGRLRVCKRAGRLWTLGSWVRQWLEHGEVQRGPAAGTNDGR
jgi:hypothetical protein